MSEEMKRLANRRPAAKGEFVSAKRKRLEADARALAKIENDTELNNYIVANDYKTLRAGLGMGFVLGAFVVGWIWFAFAMSQ